MIGDSPQRRLLGYPEAADYLGLKIGTLRSLVCREQIPYIRIGPRIIRFAIDDLETLIAERRVAVGGGR